MPISPHLAARQAGVAIQSLVGHWQRALLSSLGTTIGTMTVVLLVSIAQGVRNEVADQVRALGVNILVVIPGRIESGTFNPNLGGTSFLKESDAERVRQVHGVLRAEPFSFVGGGIHHGDKTSMSLLAATTPGWFVMHPTHLKSGRVMEPKDDDADVAVLGSVAADSLFGNQDPIGQKVTINSHDYQVIGVTQDANKQQSLFSFGSFENLVYIPYHRVKRYQPELQTSRIMIQTAPDAEPQRLLATLDKVLGEHLDHQQYQVLTEEDLLGLVYKLTGILQWLLIGLTSIGLFVGGIGIMTVMLMSVNERSKEIGIRMAVGGTRSELFAQFLLEGALLSVIGGVLGLAVAYGLDLALGKFTPIHPQITVGIVFLAEGLCLATGIVFSSLPAWRASRLHPVEAIGRE